MYEAVCAVVIKTEALTHEAEVAVAGTNEIAFAVVAVVAHEAVAAFVAYAAVMLLYAPDANVFATPAVVAYEAV